MSESTFSKEQVAALETILGVKLPEQGFTLEIKPIGQLDDAQLESVAGGFGVQQPAPLAPSSWGDPHVGLRWNSPG